MSYGLNGEWEFFLFVFADEGSSDDEKIGIARTAL